MAASLLIIACGAIAKELVQVRKLNDWSHVELQCLPAELHNSPQHIPGAVRKMIESNRERYDGIFVGYADCGTGGLLDAEFDGKAIKRLPGAHCYEFFSGPEVFRKLTEKEPGTFYLTDFLVHAFDHLVREGLGLNRHPELMEQYFGNYRRMVYLAQNKSEKLQRAARAQADYLGLEYEYVFCGLAPLRKALQLTITEDD